MGTPSVLPTWGRLRIKAPVSSEQGLGILRAHTSSPPRIGYCLHVMDRGKVTCPGSLCHILTDWEFVEQMGDETVNE